MATMLAEAFQKAVGAASEYVSLQCFHSISPHLGTIDRHASEGDEVAVQFRNDMLRLCVDPDFAIDGEKIKSFSEIFGEAHFYIHCKTNNVAIAKIPARANASTPDFRLCSDQSVTFEVKTLSVVNGSAGLRAAMTSSLEARISVENQIDDGSPFALACSELRPFGSKLEGGREVSSSINEIFLKITNNLKQEQFGSRHAFLVVNLLHIDPGPEGIRQSLVPVGYIRGIPTPVTGALWTIAFGRKGCHIHGIPHFEGLPAIETVHQYDGLLVSPENPDDASYRYIGGIMFISYSIGGEMQVSGLFRNSDWSDWHETNTNLQKTLLHVTGEFWNDDLNSNGHALLSQDEP